MNINSNVWKQNRKVMLGLRTVWRRIVEKQEEAASVYVDGGMLIAQRHVHGRAS